MCNHNEPKDCPDGPGWWAFEGKHKIFENNPAHPTHRDVHCVCRNTDGEIVQGVSMEDNSTDTNLLYFKTKGFGNKSVTVLVGKWTRVYMPWEQREVHDE